MNTIDRQSGCYTGCLRALLLACGCVKRLEDDDDDDDRTNRANMEMLTRGDGYAVEDEDRCC